MQCLVWRWMGGVLLMAMAGVVAAQSGLQGTVVAVTDGDTVTVDLGPSSPDRRLKVRLYGVDAPESKQAGGAAARAALASRVLRRQVFIEPQEQDRYGRLVGVVFLGEENINRWMLMQGHAWVYRQYERDPQACAVEAKARGQRLGVWAAAPQDWVAPWEWRQELRNQRRSTTDYSQATAAHCVESLGGRAALPVAAAEPGVPAAVDAECPVKGNISRRGRIYHTPESSGYAGTVIDPAKGERCFETVAQAEAEGWRALR